MTIDLQVLADNRDAILLAEVAALLHNLGKLDPNFLKEQVSDSSNAVQQIQSNGQFVYGYQFKRFAQPSLQLLDSNVQSLLASTQKLDPNNLPTVANDDLGNQQKKAAENFNKFYRGCGVLDSTQTNAFAQLRLTIANESWLITDLLTLFWDKEFVFKAANDDYQRTYALAQWLQQPSTKIPLLLALAHGEMSGSEKYLVSEDETTGALIVTDVEQTKTSFNQLRISTAFGFESQLVDPWQFQNERQLLIAHMPQHTHTIAQQYDALIPLLRKTLQHGLGDTQWPINEITLWDYASSIADLFKTSIAKSILEGQVIDANQMHWRLLGVRLNGLEYILQASRIADLIGRQDTLQRAFSVISHQLTYEKPIASQVYQDEQDLYFVVPDSTKLSLTEIQNEVQKCLAKSSIEDIRFAIDWSDSPLRGKQLNLGRQIQKQSPIHPPPLDTEVVKKWWQGAATEICAVCGLRPIITKQVDYCATCKDRRQKRVEQWMKSQNNTIWIDEVADANGRLALITGCFDLKDWLNGKLIESLALGIDTSTQKPVPKFASFPRVQRVWRTTQQFWQETQVQINTTLADSRRRLQIKLANLPALTKHQVYELDLLGSTHMSVLWDGNHLISTDNLSYVAAQLNIPPTKRKTPADAALEVGAWLEQNKRHSFQLISDDEKNRRFENQIADVDYQATAYSTTIPILAEPRTFMALVPADKALDIIAAIKTKYEGEMGKVRNRLPLHLGAVYFHRRTPLSAALDAGRRMLKRQSQTVTAEVVSLAPAHLPAATWPANATLTLKLGDRHIPLEIPTVMGDGTTQDVWYPYWQVAGKPSNRTRWFAGADGEHWVYLCDLRAGDQVTFTPATFDFAWLDTTARRFEIAYDEQRQRLGHATRPYLLDDLATIQQLWVMLSDKENGLTSSQIYALRDLVEAKRETWEADGIFAQLCRDAVCNAQWKKRKPETLELITNAAISGLLTDVIELYMGILKAKPQRTEEDASS